jgi:hypothetical protein
MHMSSRKSGTRHPSKPSPWDRANPKPKSARTNLTAAAKEKARARAHEAGRRYPNLVDNMWAARTGRPDKQR